MIARAIAFCRAHPNPDGPWLLPALLLLCALTPLLACLA